MIREIINDWITLCFGNPEYGDEFNYFEKSTESGPNVKIHYQRINYDPRKINIQKINSWKNYLTLHKGIKIHSFHVGNEKLYSIKSGQEIKKGKSLLVQIELIYRPRLEK